ncbi:MAG: DUF937 domain-containing protein [Anaerolineae bacterium]|nr:DUF937 domain-containing protein [Anaerolineae bacterium]
MTTLLDSITGALTPQLIEQFSAALELDAQQTRQGINVAAPLLLAAVGNKTATPEGAREVLGSLTPELQNPLDALADGRGDALLNQFLGVGAGKVAGWIQDNTGINVAPLLPLVAPLVMNAIQSASKTQNLDAAGLANLLETEKATYVRANPQLANQINAALDLGANVNVHAARIRAQFTDEEWQILIKTPALAGYAVMMSSFSGPVGINKEIAALHRAMHELGDAAQPDSLVGLVSHEHTSPDQINDLGANRTNATALMRDACLQTLKILNEKETYEETLSYKEFVVGVATRVAHAAIDGGFLSIGGTPVTKQEQQTLDLIAAALAFTP